ncbi:formyltransferase family protein [Campylobacter insulaenigrae]|uniref:phosphoribosylglycinamide formyltransferase 1 n=1 Tax=Campylobacter insulaenigrae TaxID=260714 RepID=A0ABY3G5W1_9BACT|nr:formyltransferase family protein [Campylobacter insulaenigrae]MCR6571847.1 formyl transferase [Campylobacter insulaenigrae]MCR6579303.1 formyl transferase [Campylobacter insulaenigrae]MCR6582220.1 formyl transferase [Campylobacter insulaenigrae]MCR6585281.1 formyl transferase [Campylobacter insulaenigrae]TWO27708.1 formyl transferase [Campylobacter insulaenigrae]
MIFEHIYIIGEGKVAINCKKIAEKFFNREIIFIQNSKQNELDAFFNQIKNSFIISANNFYIFKKECIKNNFIVNYHNSLLPDHKGCNAHIWSIWYDDEKSGITWHKVDENIDSGDIIIQKEIIIKKQTTALQLLQKQQNLAIQSFEECLQQIYNHSKLKIQSKNGLYHNKNSLPNNGLLDISWDRKKIINFLLAMDNGKLTNKAKINISNQTLTIIFYEINEKYIKLTLENDIILKIIKE